MAAPRIALAVLCSLALAACGGGGMSEKEFAAEGNRVCEGGYDLADPSSVDATMKELEALDAPEKARPHVKTLAGGAREIAELLPKLAGSGVESLQATRRIEALAIETRDAAFAAGLDDCAPDLPV